MVKNNKVPLIVIAALFAMSLIGSFLYSSSQQKVVDKDDFFDTKYLEVEKILNTKIDYDKFVKGSAILSHEIKNGEKIVRWQDGDRTAMYVADSENNLLMVVYFSYLKDMDACKAAYENNKEKAQKIYQVKATAGGLDHSSSIVKDNTEILLYCANMDDGNFNNFVSYTYYKKAP